MVGSFDNPVFITIGEARGLFVILVILLWLFGTEGISLLLKWHILLADVAVEFAILFSLLFDLKKTNLLQYTPTKNQIISSQIQQQWAHIKVNKKAYLLILICNGIGLDALATFDGLATGGGEGVEGGTVPIEAVLLEVEALLHKAELKRCLVGPLPSSRCCLWENKWVDKNSQVINTL